MMGRAWGGAGVRAPPPPMLSKLEGETRRARGPGRAWVGCSGGVPGWGAQEPAEGGMLTSSLSLVPPVSPPPSLRCHRGAQCDMSPWRSHSHPWHFRVLI